MAIRHILTGGLTDVHTIVTEGYYPAQSPVVAVGEAHDPGEDFEADDTGEAFDAHDPGAEYEAAA